MIRQLLRKSYDWIGRTFTLTDVEPWRGFTGNSTYAGKSVSEISAMQVSTVWSCVRGLAESVGMLPWAVYERVSAENAQKVDHPLAEILTQTPNADMDDVALKESATGNIALQGNGYALIERRNDGTILSLYPVAANRIIKKRNDRTQEIEFEFNDRGKWETLPREKVWHIPGFGMNGLIGLSPISYMREAMGLSLAAEEFGARFFGNGATVSGVVKIPQWLKPDQREIARENLNQKYAGLGNAHKLMLLEGGMEFSQGTTMPLEDAQYMLLRGFQVDEICRIFRYPPHMVAKLDRATFSNIEEMSIEYVVYTLAPYLVRLERAANRWLLKPDERSRFFVRFNVDGLLRGDAETRAKFYAAMLQNGVYSRNEVRALENRNSIAGQGMDDYTVQSNMALIDQIGLMLAAKQGSGSKESERVMELAGKALDRQQVFNLDVRTVTAHDLKEALGDIRPIVKNEIKMPAQELKVTVPKPEVTVRNLVEAPKVNVTMPERINITGMPERVTTSETERDSDGKITRVTQTERDK